MYQEAVTRETYVCRGVLDGDGRVQKVIRAAIRVHQLTERRQTTEEA